MYLATLSKHPHVNSNQLIITVYKIHYLIQSRSMTYASISGSIMSNLVDLMTKDNLDTDIIAHDKNLTIMIFFILCYVSWTSLIDLKTISIHLINEHQYNKYV